MSGVTGSRKFTMAAAKPEIHISSLQDKIATKFQRITLHFRGPATKRGYWEYCKTKPEVENPRWWPKSRKCRPPYWIFHFRFGRAVFQPVPLSCWTSKTQG